MRIKVCLACMVLLVLTVLTSKIGVAVECENPVETMIGNIRSYVWNDMEEMALDFPNAVIPYRGSDKLCSLNNSIVCCGMDGGVGIKGFTQTNNVLPINWSSEFSIGMDYADLSEILQTWNYAVDGITLDYTEEGEVQIVKCNYYNELTCQAAFELQFYVYCDQIYQIEFQFI